MILVKCDITGLPIPTFFIGWLIIWQKFADEVQGKVEMEGAATLPHVLLSRRYGPGEARMYKPV